ncbi:M56 family metallopeptidase [Flavobacterium reichenbachii]|uniref:Peptidase M56 n=1 Tax=Flavobacterium reichenbachii TaxID=362418 RepID=A0A085ZJU1_9FLAO|nr:M56 family metallopeptidase [Flavobacterium reichenbachii]KFF04705.1 peptidase M56 [Flavobacterium reichenbachii]OXB09899.1 peptidase M56 [Flavobacterium reichenbachii]
METLFIYIVKSSGLLVLFYSAYYFLLRKETFFNSNRYFLLTGLVTAVIMPLLVYKKIVWVDSVSANSNFQSIIPQIIKKEHFQINWFYIAAGVYALGLLLLLIKFALDFYNLNSVLKGKKIKQQADFKFVDVNENIAPFSYFDYIVYNSSMYTEAELESIIEHEKVHSDQNHTIDILISRIFCILFWFNPISWLYKKAITQNLEFIADSEASKKLSDKKAYQYTLLKITTHENCVAITNHFYQSLIKKRIVMLNKNQSKKRNSWKFYTVVPALVAFVLLFQVEVIAREKQLSKKEIAEENIKSVDVYKIKKTTTDKELTEVIEKLKANHNLDVLISDVKRNDANEITAIKISVKNGKDQAQAMQLGGSKAIKDYGIVVITKDDGSKKIDFNTNDSAEGDQKVKIVKSNKTKKVKNTKTDDVTNKNSYTTTYSNSNSNNVTTLSVQNGSDSNETTSVSVSSKPNSKIVVKSSNNSKQLVIVDGVVMPASVGMDDLESLDISSMDVISSSNAVVKYGEQGENGVIVITTKK